MAPQQGTIPPPPPGFSPVTTSAPASPSASTSIPPPPPGFSPVSTPPNDFGTGGTGVVNGLVSGFEKEANKTGQGVINLLNAGNRVLAGGAGGDVPSLPVVKAGEDLNTHGAAETIGGGAENIAEYAAGDELLKFGLTGVAKARKLVELAEKYPSIAKTLAAAKDHPIIAKMITEAGKGAAVGGAQGAVKGAEEGNAVGGAESGAAGGAAGVVAGTAVGETLGVVMKWLGEKAGLISDITKDASVGMKPHKGNVNAITDFIRVAPKLYDEHQIAPARTIEDWANKAQAVREGVYQNVVEPLLQKYGSRPLDGLGIANRIRNDIPEALIKFSPEKAAQIEQFANEFLPEQRFSMNAQDAERYIQHLNAELTATGYWKLPASGRAALEKVNPDIIKWKAGADAIRDELYGKLGDWQLQDHVPNPVDMAAAKKDYGAARNVENELRGQVNVNNRQSKISLKELIGLALGVAHGGPVGATVAALPVADKIFNSQPASFERAVKAVARPGEGAAANVVRGATALKNAGEGAAAANIGAQTGRLLDRLFFTAGDGSMHSVPNNPDAINQVHQIDPNAKFHEAPQQ